MLFKIAVVALATAMGSFAAQADISGPSSLPPAGFKGQQFVDSSGCIFLKAGYGGQVTWVARVTRDRKPLCGYPPTFGPQPVIEVAEDTPVVVPAKPAAAKPAAVAAAVPAPAPAKPAKPAPVAVAAAQPAPLDPLQIIPRAEAAAKPAKPAPKAAPKYEVAAGNGVPAGKIGCYADAPVAERVKLRSGGTVVVCTPGDGGLSGWRPPIYPDGSRVGVALSETAPQTKAGKGKPAAEVAATAVPKGYKLAWKDDRLNPLRGQGTAEGQADQDQVWTKKVPAKLAATKTKKPAQVTVSTKSAATDPVEGKAAAKPKSASGAYVQIGTFGQPSNAKGASARLKALGLPVAISKITKGGKALQIVLAGPFGSGAEAAQALSTLRGAGFGDAFIR